MGVLDLKNEPRHWTRIRQALRRRGFNTDKDEEWEIHGPHFEMDYQVYIGYAYVDADPSAKCLCPDRGKKVQMTYCRAHKQWSCVAIYPRAVYEIEDEGKWAADAIPENRIPCI